MVANPFSNKPPGFWSLVTTDESVERGQVNFWAILETALAMVMFWYIALRWHTFFLLYSSLFIAPLLLLRSESSTRDGIKSLQGRCISKPIGSSNDLKQSTTYVKPIPKPLPFHGFWVGIAISLALLIVSYPAAKSFISGYNGWEGAWRGAIFVYVFVVIAASLAAGLAESVALFGAFLTAGVGAWEVILLVGEPSATLGAFPAAVASTLTGLVVLSLARALAFNGAVAKPGTIPVLIMEVGSGWFHISMYGVARADGYGWIPIVAALIYFVPVLLCGILIVALSIRIRSTLRYFLDCYAAIPTNLRRLSIFTAPTHAPELVPGLPVDSSLRFGSMLIKARRHLAEEGFAGKILGLAYALTIPTWFTVGWVYRAILKSTFWLWWILFVVGGAPETAEGIEGIRADSYRKLGSWILIAASIFTLSSFFFSQALKPLIANYFSDTPLIASVALLAMIDWSRISILQWCALLSSILTVGVIIWTHGLVVDTTEVPGRENRLKKQLPWLGYLVKWKTAFGMMSIALLMAYVALYANAIHHWLRISTWMFGWLELVYGENAQVLLGSF